MATAVYLTGQATTSQDSGEASESTILDNYPQARSRESQLLLKDAMGFTDDLLSEGYLSNLHIKTVDGINMLSGKDSLAVILANTKLAELIP